MVTREGVEAMVAREGVEGVLRMRAWREWLRMIVPADRCVCAVSTAPECGHKINCVAAESGATWLGLRT